MIQIVTKAKRLLNKWVERLKLKDWIIVVRQGSQVVYVSNEKAVTSETNLFAEVFNNPEVKEASIYLYRTRSELEDTIKHELLHVVLSPLTSWMEYILKVNFSPAEIEKLLTQLNLREHKVLDKLDQIIR